VTELTIHDIDRSQKLRDVTDNFFFWQGLRFVSLGPVLILAGIVASLPEVHEKVGNLVLVAGIVAATFASTRLGRRYRREFGSVSPRPGAHRTRSLAKWLLVYPLMFGTFAIDLLWPTPILFSALVWGVAILLYRRSTGGGREHYLVLAATLAALAIAPLAAGVTSKEMSYVMFIVLGAGYSVCAWLDDREMRRVLKGA
jgi:hypothetical protein